MFNLKRQSFLIIALALALLFPSFSSAVDLNLDYPEFGGFDLNRDQNLNEVIAWFYYFIVSIGGLAAFVMLIWGGFQYLTSVGNPSKIGEAKDRIYSAFLGLIIILASYLIIQTINPELLMLNLPKL